MKLINKAAAEGKLATCLQCHVSFDCWVFRASEIQSLGSHLQLYYNAGSRAFSMDPYLQANTTLRLQYRGCGKLLRLPKTVLVIVSASIVSPV